MLTIWISYLLVINVARAQNCGIAWQRPCDGTCNTGSVLYSPANLCAPCGGDTQLCCLTGEVCGPKLDCLTIPNPFDNRKDGTPLGLTRICVLQDGPSTLPPNAEHPADQPTGFLNEDPSESCPAMWQQCGGLNFNGKQGCCQSGSNCVFINQWYHQCLEGPQSTPPDASPEEPLPQPPQEHEPMDASPQDDMPAPTEPSAEPPVQPPQAQGTPRMSHKETGEMVWLSSQSPEVTGAAEWKYPLDTMLGMSYFFYEVNRAGRLPPTTRAPWRADTLKSSTGGSLDGQWEGGYFDAGDHNIFQLPHAYSIARLAWIVHAFPEGLQKTYFDGESNFKWAYEAAKWGADFLAKSVEKDRVLLHIGDIAKDHNYLGRAEDYPQMNRNIRFCDSGECSDVTGEIAAALAHAAVAFKDNKDLQSAYWQKAKMAYMQTGSARGVFGNSNDAYNTLRSYYPSTGVVSHVFFAAASMYTACQALQCPDAAEYLSDANRFGVMKEADGGQKWFWEVPGWDNAWWDGAILMTQAEQAGPLMFGKPAFTQFLSGFADKWTNGKSPIRLSAQGQRFTLKWGSNRFAMSGAAILLMWAKLPASMRELNAVDPHSAQCAAVKQIHYMAGDNDRGSYIAGFGTNPPRRNHHRNACCAPWEQAEDNKVHCQKYFVDVMNPRNSCSGVQADAQGRCYLTANRPNKFITHGALIGGPKTPTDAGNPSRVPYSTEGWNDWRTDWIGSEQTIDYNAHFTLALAAATELPLSFWTSKCGGINTNLQLGEKVGLDRSMPPPASGYTFADFEQYGWTRTLSDAWITTVPGS